MSFTTPPVNTLHARPDLLPFTALHYPSLHLFDSFLHAHITHFLKAFGLEWRVPKISASNQPPTHTHTPCARTHTYAYMHTPTNTHAHACTHTRVHVMLAPLSNHKILIFPPNLSTKAQGYILHSTS
jgi:hypothetical protein